MLPQWTMLPFAAVILSISVLPAIAPGFWKKYHHLWLAMLTLPILMFCYSVDAVVTLKTLKQFVVFVALLSCLYAIGSGLYVGGVPKANPGTNLMFFSLGAVLSLVIGGLGSAILLFKPLIRSNRGRKRLAHVVIFFIIIVCNVGGIVSPLGNSATLLAYLFGVPVEWNMQLFPIWIFVLFSLLGVFVALDTFFYMTDPDFRGPASMENQENFRILGGWTLLLAFLPLICLVAAQRIQFPQEHLREAFLVVCLGIITFITRKLTPKQVDHANQFTWHLFSEQVVIWGALFITWIPVLSIFTQLAPQLSVDNSWRIFWLTGAFSAVFNQVPVFTAFYALARGVGEDVQMVQLISGNAISGLLLTSVICSSSLFSGATYVGNVSNLLVQRQVQLEGLRIPSGIKMIIASLILVAPVAFITAFVFFVR